MARRVLAGGAEHQSATVKCRAAASVRSITSSGLNGAELLNHPPELDGVRRNGERG